MKLQLAVTQTPAKRESKMLKSSFRTGTGLKRENSKVEEKDSPAKQQVHKRHAGNTSFPPDAAKRGVLNPNSEVRARVGACDKRAPVCDQPT